MSSTYRGPTAGGVLRLAVLAIIIVIALQWFTGTDSGASQVDRKADVSLCEEHGGRPGWKAVCEETARRR